MKILRQNQKEMPEIKNTVIDMKNAFDGLINKISLGLVQFKVPVRCRGFPDSSVGKESSSMKETPVGSWVGKICWRWDRLPIPVFLGSLWDSAGKESACNAEDLGSIPGLGRCPGEGKGYPLEYSGLENSMDCIAHGVAQSEMKIFSCNTCSLGQKSKP